jgi:twitching motility protein PilT
MLANKLFPLLARPEVQEIVLLGGKPPCALVGGTYRRLSSQTLRDEDILAVVVAARGQERIPLLAQGTEWTFQLASVGKIAVTAGYEGSVLRMTLRIGHSRAVRDMNAGTLAEEAAPPPQPTAAARAPAGPTNWEAPDAFAGGRGSQPQVAAVQPRGQGARPPDTQPRAPALDDPRRDPLPQPRAAARVVPGDTLDQLLGRARELRASDLHVLADRPAMLRIAGELVPQPETPSAEQAEQLLRVRVPDALREVLDSQGSCDFSLVHESFGRFRANVSRQRTGYKLTARPIGQVVPTLAELGMPETIANALEHHQGLIVITGPTGHGKTTTLSALVGILNRETTHHVITVEDPIEYVHETARAVISQREVGTHTKTFQAALKGALREDPDVIVVGELRDTETVRMALSASETGHLVISTMNTPSAAKAIERLIDLFPPGDQPQVRMTLAGGLRLIISQRLLPTADQQGLCAAAEVLPGCTPLWNLIRENRTYQIASLQQRGKSLGIIRLDDSLADLVKKGRTTLEIARGYAESADLLEAMVLGKPSAREAERGEPPEPANEQNPLQKRGVELGKQVMSRAGKLFGGESK